EWAQVDKTSIAGLETFLRLYGSSAEAEYARARLAELKKQVTPPSVPEKKAEYLFDGMWRVTGTGDKNCTLKTWHWRDPIRITGSHIEGRGGSAKGRVWGDGSFKIIVQSKGVGTFTGAFRGGR